MINLVEVSQSKRDKSIIYTGYKLLTIHIEYLNAVDQEKKPTTNLTSNPYLLLFLYINDPYEPRYQSLIIKRDELLLYDAYNINNDWKPGANRKTLIVFDDMIDDVISEYKLDRIATELFIMLRKLDIYSVFNLQSN